MGRVWLAYRGTRAALAAAADRVSEHCDRRLREAGRAGAGPDETRRLLAWGARAALVSQLPRCDCTHVATDFGQFQFLGPGNALPELLDCLGADRSNTSRGPRVEWWRLEDAAAAALSAGRLVICALPMAAPTAWCGNARWRVRVPSAVDQVLSLGTPLDDLLHGGDARQIRRNLHRADRAGVRAGVTRSLVAFRDFFARMYRPHVEGRHGALAKTTSEQRQWDDWMAPGGELIFLVVEDRTVAGVILLPGRDTSFLGEEGIAPEARGREYHAGLQAALKRAAIERAQSLGSRWLSLGNSRAQAADGNFRTKAMWSARVQPAGRSSYPDWVLLANDLAPDLRERLNSRQFVSLDVPGGACVRFVESTAARTAPRPGAPGLPTLLVGPDGQRSVVEPRQ
jgi:hypothetical protein